MVLPAAQEILRARALLAYEGPTPRVGVVLGSGLGGFAEQLTESAVVPYSQIVGMPSPDVAGHSGQLHLGKLDGCVVACLQGRAHAYEGHAVEAVCFGVTLLAALGCSAVLLTNAAGGIDVSFRAGDLMLITDHINLTGLNPLRGPADARTPRFVDLSRAYDVDLCQCARDAASLVGVPLKEGTYAGLLGPTYETPAEIRMLRTLGAHAVGMSTVLEVIALRGLGVPVGAISCITNLAAGMSEGRLSHDEVQATAQAVQPRFEQLMRRWIGLADQALASQ